MKKHTNSTVTMRSFRSVLLSPRDNGNPARTQLTPRRTILEYAESADPDSTCRASVGRSWLRNSQTGQINQPGTSHKHLVPARLAHRTSLLYFPYIATEPNKRLPCPFPPNNHHRPLPRYSRRSASGRARLPLISFSPRSQPPYLS